LEESDKRWAKVARWAAGPQNLRMLLDAAEPLVPSAGADSAVTRLFIYDIQQDTPRVSIPHAESHLVVRFGPSIQNRLDVYAFGAQERARRKRVPGGHRIIMARLHLGAHERVLGVAASALAGRYVPLEELWGAAATGCLTERLAQAHTPRDAADVLRRAIAERVAARAHRGTLPGLALQAAAKLGRANVNEVAGDLGVSERHLRRVFRETVGVSPKAFAKLARFHRALSAARERTHRSWASIAAFAGYYDQAHLIADFRAIAGVTPQALLGELSAAAT
jgi:AraC-like DNA-binding protein